MSSLSPHVKRRRLNDAQSTLSKPFKSPLRRLTTVADSNIPTRSEAENNGNGDKQTSGKDCGAQLTNDENRNDTPGSLQPSRSPVSLSHQLSTVTQNTSEQPSDALLLAPSVAPVLADSIPVEQRIPILQKRVSSLHAQLSKLRNEFDTTTQALKIAQSNQDPELEKLIVKWRMVAREVAEELYAGARERVNRMGGVGVWRDKIRQSKLRKAEWDATVNDNDANDDEAEQYDIQQEREERKRELEDEIATDLKNGEDANEEESGTESDETFTMDMMLKSLNIDLRLIGFDKENQRWVD